MRKTAQILLMGLLLLPSALRAELTRNSFNQDLSYYYKSAKAEKLSSNDRLFILNRLREKYKTVKFDVTELYGEIDKWSEIRIREKKKLETAQTAQEAPVTPEAPTALLSELSISEKKDLTRMLLSVPGLDEYKEIPVQGDEGKEPSAAVIYLYNTKNKLPIKLQTLKPKKGFIREVRVKRVTAKPPTVKVSISFRKNMPYDIERTGDQLVLNVYNTARQWQAQGPTPSETVDSAPEADLVPPADSSGPVLNKFGPLEATPLTLHYSTQIIEPGQIVTADFLQYSEFGRTTVVAPDGNARIVPAGLTMAAGISSDQLSDAIAKKIEDLYLKPAVKVSAKDFDAKQNIALIGAVKNSGAFAYRGGIGCYELISRSGGFVAGANKKAVLIHRMTAKSRKKLIFDIEEFTNSASPAGDFNLEPGDIVEVQKIPEVYVYGEVKSPNFYRLKEPTSLTKALLNAGGFTDKSDGTKITLIREDDGQNLKRVLNLNDVKNNPELEPVVSEGDLIYVPSQKGKSKFLNKETISWGAFFMSLGLVLALLV